MSTITVSGKTSGQYGIHRLPSTWKVTNLFTCLHYSQFKYLTILFRCFRKATRQLFTSFRYSQSSVSLFWRVLDILAWQKNAFQRLVRPTTVLSTGMYTGVYSWVCVIKTGNSAYASSSQRSLTSTAATWKNSLKLFTILCTNITSSGTFCSGRASRKWRLLHANVNVSQTSMTKPFANWWGGMIVTLGQI